MITKISPEYVVDCTEQQGSIRAIHGANIGPLCQNGYVDLSRYHRRIAFPTIRLHDCLFYCWDVVDTPSIFPLFHLDVQDPRNYRFAKTDAYIQSILDCGSKIVYRLGVSIQNHKKFHFDTDPPPDYDKWADICINIIRHYNEGWAEGFQHGIAYWEIWNEPENTGAAMWNATYDEYILFYIRVSKRIKAACPEIKIGGPAMNGEALTNWDRLHTFFGAVREAGAPVDFCSWHAYPEDPTQLVTAARNVRAILDQHGYTETESHLNEWNLAPFKGRWSIVASDPLTKAPYMQDYTARKKGHEGAAMAAACLIAMQDAPIDMANFYEAGNGEWGMFAPSGVPTKPYYAFLAFRQMLDRTPLRCAVHSTSNSGIFALAGTSADGCVVQVLLANYDSVQCQCQYPIEFKNLPEGRWRVQHRIVDAHSNLEAMDTLETDLNAVALPLDVHPRTVHLLTLERILTGNATTSTSP